LQEEADRAAGIEPKPPRQKRRKRPNAGILDGAQQDKPAAPAVAASTAEAAKTVLMASSKRNSKKINYAVLDHLFEIDEERVTQKTQELRNRRDETPRA
jgi:hypothetical protein